jgi:hypothetical protein
MIKVSQCVWGECLQSNHWFHFVEQINRRYCKRHGYGYVAEKLEHHGQADRSPYWAKVPHIKRMLSDCEYLLFLDGDACFPTHTITIESSLHLLPEDKVLLGAIGVDGNGYPWGSGNLGNVGALLFRNCETAHQILHDWDTMTERHEYHWTR